MSLTDFQEQFAASLLTQKRDASQARSLPYFADPEQAMRFYDAARARALTAWTAQLQAIYPTVARIMGEQEFQDAAAGYFTKHLPNTPHPVESVEAFAYFAETLPHTQTYSFLPDIATLDLGYHKSFHTIDVEAVKTRVFTELAPEALAGKRLQLHPACFWFSSAYAVHDIWRMHHSPMPPKSIQYHTPQDVVIVRPALTVEVHKIDSGFAHALDQLDAGETLQNAFHSANRIDNSFKAVAAMQFLIQNNLIVNLS